MASAHLNERRELRYAIVFPIAVTWIDREGRVFQETAATSNVSEWGCGFLSSLPLAKDDIVLLRRIPSSEDPAAHTQAAFFQVMRAEHTPHGVAIGAWKMDSVDVWEVDPTEFAKPNEGRIEARQHSNSADGPDTKDS